MKQVWVALDSSGKVVLGGHNRPRFYTKTAEGAIKWASEDSRVKTIVQFKYDGVIWERK